MTSARKKIGSSKINAVTPIAVQPPFPGRGIFMFGPAKEPANIYNVFGMTCTPVYPVSKTRPNNYLQCKDNSKLIYPEKRKTSKKLRQ